MRIVAVEIKARPLKGFWRCGVYHPHAATTYPADRFTGDQLAALVAEPMLEVALIPLPEVAEAAPAPEPDSAPAAPAAEAEPAKVLTLKGRRKPARKAEEETKS